MNPHCNRRGAFALVAAAGCLWLGTTQAAPDDQAAAEPTSTTTSAAAAADKLRTALANLAFVGHVVIKVTDKDAAADALVAEAAAVGGYFASRTEREVNFRIPIQHADAFMARAATAGILIQRDVNKPNLGEEMERLRSLTASQQEVLNRYLDVLKDAGASQIVTVEREVVRQIEALERHKGSLRLLEHRAQYAQITVAFQFRERQAPARDGASSFGWLNTVNLAELLGDFNRDE